MSLQRQDQDDGENQRHPPPVRRLSRASVIHEQRKTDPCRRVETCGAGQLVAGPVWYPTLNVLRWLGSCAREVGNGVVRTDKAWRLFH